MKQLMTLLLSLSLTLNCFADCEIPVKALEKGSPAPCKGFLFSPQKELEVRLMKKEYDLQKLEVSTLETIIDRYEKKELEFEKIITLENSKTELWKTRAEDITLKYTSLEENRSKRDFMFVLAGIGLTVLAGYAIGQAAQAGK